MTRREMLARIKELGEKLDSVTWDALQAPSIQYADPELGTYDSEMLARTVTVLETILFSVK